MPRSHNLPDYTTTMSQKGFKHGDVPRNKGKSLCRTRKNSSSNKGWFTKDHTRIYGSSNTTNEAEPEQPVVSHSYARLDATDYAVVVKPGKDGHSITTPDCEGRPGSNLILRPSCSTLPGTDLQQTNENESSGGLRLIDNDKMLQMITETMRLHQASFPGCTDPDITQSYLQ